MQAEQLGCFNCKASFVKAVPIVENGKVSEHAYWGLVSCRQRLSDHYKHYVELTHVCAWHSDTLSHDERFPSWRESINLPEGGN